MLTPALATLWSITAALINKGFDNIGVVGNGYDKALWRWQGFIEA